MPADVGGVARKLPAGTIAPPMRIKDRPTTNNAVAAKPVVPSSVRSRIMEPAKYPVNATEEQKKEIDEQRAVEEAEIERAYFAYPRANNPSWRLRIRIGMEIWWYRGGNVGASPECGKITAVTGDTISCAVWGPNRIEMKSDVFHVSHANAKDPRKFSRDTVGLWDFIPTPEREAISDLELKIAELQAIVDELLTRPSSLIDQK